MGLGRQLCAYRILLLKQSSFSFFSKVNLVKRCINYSLSQNNVSMLMSIFVYCFIFLYLSNCIYSVVICRAEATQLLLLFFFFAHWQISLKVANFWMQERDHMTVTRQIFIYLFFMTNVDNYINSIPWWNFIAKQVL